MHPAALEERDVALFWAISRYQAFQLGQLHPGSVPINQPGDAVPALPWTLVASGFQHDYTASAHLTERDSLQGFVGLSDAFSNLSGLFSPAVSHTEDCRRRNGEHASTSSRACRERTCKQKRCPPHRVCQIQEGRVAPGTPSAGPFSYSAYRRILHVQAATPNGISS